MAISISFNGVVYSIPEVGDESWGESLTSYFTAIPQGALQKVGGSFTLTANVNFGPNFGLLAQYYTTRTTNAATAGNFRLARTDVISWRNQANGANLDLGVNASNQLTFGGGTIVTGGITALTGDVTATGPGSVAATVAFVGGVSAANVATGANLANAATDLNTVSTIVKRDGSGNFAAGTITASLTGVASGNTTITPAQYGVVVSGAANVLGVIAPDASTTKVLVSGGASANPSWQDIATGALALGAFGSSPNSSGATLATGTLTLQPADGTNPGGVTAGSQTFGGVKTFTLAPIVTALTASQVVVSDGSKALASVAYVSAPTVSTIMSRDSNANVRTNNFIPNYATTATAAGTTSLLVGSAYVQVFTGATTQIVKLPAADTLPQTGTGFFIINKSSGVITVQDDGGNVQQAMAADSFAWFTVTNIGSANGAWNSSYSVNNAGGGTVTSVAMTLPSVLFTTPPTGSPITTTGTLALALATQAANTIFAGPTDGSAATPTFRAISSADSSVGFLSNDRTQNLGIGTSVAANALTITLKQNDGSTDATAASPVVVGFRSSTITSGAYLRRTVTSSLSLVVPAGASLGQTSAVAQYVWVYLLDNAGTLELAVSGVKLFDDYSVQSSTTIGAGSTSGTTLYSSTGRSNVPTRLIGRLLVTEATAGTWASAVTEVALVSGKQSPNITDWGQTLVTITPTNFGTISNSSIWSKREGDTLKVRGVFTSGTGSGSAASIVFSGLTIDSGKFSAATSTQQIGYLKREGSGNPWDYATGQAAGGNVYGAVFYDGSTTSTLFVGFSTSPSTLTKSAASAILASGDVATFEFSIPIAGWSTYGP